MSRSTLPLTDQLQEYILKVSLREPGILARLRDETAALPNAEMQIAPEQGQFMALLARLIGAKKVLEVGVFTGYSSLAVALALPADGTLIALDVSEEYTTIARRYWDEAGLGNRIRLRLAPAMDSLDRMIATGEANSFDMAFIDADKEAYDGYVERVLTLLRPGGLLLIDNALMGGDVANADVISPSVRAVDALNRKLHRDDRVDVSLLPIADGLMLVRKR